ncbi:MAG TPA: DUF5667 domain-containing protein [Candidatus Paceibacterota bacterium]
MIKLPLFTRDAAESIRPLKAIRLEESSKERMRAALSAYADLHAFEAVLSRAGAEASPLSAFFSRTRSLYAGALMLTLMVAGGTQASIAAEGSVPGDILYPLKVSIVEPVALMLSLSPERKAELSAEFASRRVEEAATLASSNKLDDSRADELAARFDTHVDELAKETVALESRGELGVSLAVRSDLSQKVSQRTEEIANDGAPAAMMAKQAAAEEPEARFSARIAEKSKTLATTRERLDIALALDASEATATAMTFSSMPANPAVAGSGRFFAALGLERATTSTSTASTTATSTLPQILVPFFTAPSSNR